MKDGFEVVRFDLRGMGRSGGARQWVTRFEEYVEDVTEVWNWIQRAQEEKPLFLMGHSLGGLIALHFAKAYDRMLCGIVLSAPACRIGRFVSPWTIAVGKTVAKFAPKIPMPKTEIGLGLSRDPAVTEAYRRDPLCNHFNTLGQASQVLRAMGEVPSVYPHLKSPLLVVHGSHDYVISPEGSFEIVRRAGSVEKLLHFLPLGHHEPHNDIDQEYYFGLLTQWLNRIVRTKPYVA